MPDNQKKGGKMKTIIVIMCILMAAPVAAWDGEIFIGKYINSTLRTKPGGGYTIPNKYAEFVVGLEIGHRVFEDTLLPLRPYIKSETLIDEYSEDSFHPASIKYEIGIRAEIWKGLYADFSHLCWHPVDSFGDVEQYNLIKVGVKF